MNYTKLLVDRLKDADEGWPHFETEDFMVVLEEFAEEAFAKNSVEGHLAALLIWHQLCEEMAKLLLRDAQFCIQLSVHPAEIEFPEKRKLMFGQVLDDLSNTISFAYKKEFLDACRKLNTQRIKVVHGLTRHTSLADIMDRVVQTTKSTYDQILNIFAEAHDDFRVNFHSFAKDALEFMEEEIAEDEKVK